MTANRHRLPPGPLGFSRLTIVSAGQSAHLAHSTGIVHTSTQGLSTTRIRGEEGTHLSTLHEVNPPQFREYSDAEVAMPNRVFGVVVANEFVVDPPPGTSEPFKVFRGFRTAVEGGIIGQRDKRLLLHTRRTDSLPRGIYIGGWGKNWYMWLSTTLATAYLTRFLPKRYEAWPLLLPEEIRSRKNWMSSLSALALDRPVAFVAAGRSVKVQNLVSLSPPLARGPRSAVPEAEAPADYINRGVFTEFSAHLKHWAGPAAPSRRPESLFIYRGPGAKRDYNEADLLDVARGFGVEPIDFSQLTFRETIHAIESARLVIGAHGAGWTNLLFAEPGTTGIYWAEETKKFNPNFPNLASAFGVSLEILWMKKHHDKLRLDPDLLVKSLQSYFGDSGSP